MKITQELFSNIEIVRQKLSEIRECVTAFEVYLEGEMVPVARRCRLQCQEAESYVEGIMGGVTEIDIIIHKKYVKQLNSIRAQEEMDRAQPALGPGSTDTNGLP